MVVFYLEYTILLQMMLLRLRLEEQAELEEQVMEVEVMVQQGLQVMQEKQFQ